MTDMAERLQAHPRQGLAMVLPSSQQWQERRERVLALVWRVPWRLAGCWAILTFVDMIRKVGTPEQNVFAFLILVIEAGLLLSVAVWGMENLSSSYRTAALWSGLFGVVLYLITGAALHAVPGLTLPTGFVRAVAGIVAVPHAIALLYCGHLGLMRTRAEKAEQDEAFEAQRPYREAREFVRQFLGEVIPDSFAPGKYYRAWCDAEALVYGRYVEWCGSTTRDALPQADLKEAFNEEMKDWRVGPSEFMRASLGWYVAEFSPTTVEWAEKVEYAHYKEWCKTHHELPYEQDGFRRAVIEDNGRLIAASVSAFVRGIGIEPESEAWLSATHSDYAEWCASNDRGAACEQEFERVKKEWCEQEQRRREEEQARARQQAIQEAEAKRQLAPAPMQKYPSLDRWAEAQQREMRKNLADHAQERHDNQMR